MSICRLPSGPPWYILCASKTLHTSNTIDFVSLQSGMKLEFRLELKLELKLELEFELKLELKLELQLELNSS